jgi:DNA-directed RNA polymerase I subunit RPA2
MLRKLFSLVSGSCCADNPDSPQHQEVLLPGTLYGMIIKERMEDILNNIRNAIALDVRDGAAVDFNDSMCTHDLYLTINYLTYL